MLYVTAKLLVFSVSLFKHKLHKLWGHPNCNCVFVVREWHWGSYIYLVFLAPLIDVTQIDRSETSYIVFFLPSPIHVDPVRLISISLPIEIYSVWQKQSFRHFIVLWDTQYFDDWSRSIKEDSHDSFTHLSERGVSWSHQVLSTVSTLKSDRVIAQQKRLYDPQFTSS